MKGEFSGSLPAVIYNQANLYEGDLIYYFKTVFHRAQNLNNPYHNFRHVFHVLWLCHEACMYYHESLNPRDMRNLLIAAMFHDFDHPGIMGDDDLNIERAVRGLARHIHPKDHLHLDDIVKLIRATEWPYKTASETLALSAQIIRDADLSQCFSVAWIQQTLFGLASEWGKKPFDVLKGQIDFLNKLRFFTEWAQRRFPQSDIDEKLDEVRGLISLLE